MIKKIPCVLALAALLLPATYGRAADEGKLKAKFLFGYRLADWSGSENKYREDINLDDGPRLFSFQLSYAPSGDLRKLLDEVTLNLYNFGGDPFESFRLSLVKYGKCTMTYERLKAEYFYADEQWIQPLYFWQMRESVGGDFHTYDFDRTIDRAAAKIWLGSKAHLFLNFDRFSKKGNSTTTFDFARDEFEFDRPVDQSSKEVAIGLDYSIPKLTLAVEERIRDYKDSNSYFLPGFSEGENFGYPSPNSANLFNFFSAMPYDTRSYTHTVKIIAKPAKDLMLKAGFSIISLNMDNLDYSESYLGTNYDASKLWYESFENAFDLSRRTFNFDVDLSYLFSDTFAFVAAFRSNNFKQDGMFEFETNNILPTPSTVPFAEEAAYRFKTIGFDGGLQFQPLAKLSLTIGMRSEARTIEFEGGRPEEKTERLGLFGNLNWQPAPYLKLGADYQFGDYKDQVMPVGPATSNRLHLTARFKKSEWYANGSFLMTKITNDTPLFNPAIEQPSNGWKSTSANLGLRLGHMGKKMNASAGWAMIHTKSTANDRLMFSATPPGWPIYFSGKTNLLDVSLGYTVNGKWSLGAMLGYYTAPAYYGGYYVYQATNNTANSAQPTFTKDTGYQNRDLSRLTFKPCLEYTIDNTFLVQLSYWLTDFKDPFVIRYTTGNVGFDNNYKANVVELSFGYQL